MWKSILRALNRNWLAISGIIASILQLLVEFPIEEAVPLILALIFRQILTPIYDPRIPGNNITMTRYDRPGKSTWEIYR